MKRTNDNSVILVISTMTVTVIAMLLIGTCVEASAQPIGPAPTEFMSQLPVPLQPPTIVQTGSGNETNFLNELAKIILGAVATAMSLITMYFMPMLFKALEKRIHVDIPDPMEREAMRIARDGISYGKEWVRKRVKEIGDDHLDDEILNQAAEYFRRHASRKVMKFVNGQVEDYVSSKLPEVGGSL